MRTYENPQKNESTLGCQSLESIYQGVGITGYRKQKWKGKKKADGRRVQGMKKN